jgi:hypothetical protein
MTQDLEVFELSFRVLTVPLRIIFSTDVVSSG